ncbi:MAG: TolC family protein [Acidobacteriota bacterium]
MAEVVELVPKGALDRVQKANTKAGRTAGARFARVAPSSEEEGPEQPQGEEAARTEMIEKESADASTRQDACGPRAGGTSALPRESAARPGETPRTPEAAECFDMFEIGEGCVGVVWRLGKVDDWTAPILGAACKEILGKKRNRKVVFDFSGVDEMSTAGVSTLVRFKNTIIHLDKAMYLVAGPRLRAQLAASYVDRMIEVVDSVARVVGSEIRFEERPMVRGQRRWWWFWLVFMVFQCLASGQEAGETPAPPEKFPSLKELERQLEGSPELLALRLEADKLALAQSWTRNVNLHAGYSQHFAAYVPVLSEKDRQVSGDTFVVGVSVSVSLDDLLHKRKNRDLELKMKQVEYERLFQTKLAALRVLYGNRLKLLEELKAIDARSRTLELKLEKVKAALRFEYLEFDPIDLAEAEEAVARVRVEKAQTELEIRGLETRMMEIVGKVVAAA